MPTLKQLADELCVSKQAIRKHVNQLPPTMVSTGNNRTIVINDDGANIIRRKVSTKQTQVDTNQTPTVDTAIIAILQKELDEKNALIKAQQQSISELTAALENTTTSLAAAQALHAGTMKKQIESPIIDLENEEKQPQGFFSRLFKRK